MEVGVVALAWAQRSSSSLPTCGHPDCLHSLTSSQVQEGDSWAH